MKENYNEDVDMPPRIGFVHSTDFKTFKEILIIQRWPVIPARVLRFHNQQKFYPLLASLVMQHIGPYFGRKDREPPKALTTNVGKEA